MFISELFRILKSMKLEPMKQLVALMMCAVSLGAAAQSTITYPYNPDGDADSLIGVSDIQDLLSGYGLPFSPSEILVDGQTLPTVLTSTQNSIDSTSCGQRGSVLDMPLGTVLPIDGTLSGIVFTDTVTNEVFHALYDLKPRSSRHCLTTMFYPATTFNIPSWWRNIIGANDMGRLAV